jgi:uncharacterized protein (TIGR00369 family)
MQIKMSAAEVQTFLAREFPQHYGPGRSYRIEAVGPGTARTRFTTNEKHLRPGNTISGPTLMAIADSTMYVALLAAIGPIPLAVTTNLNINFLRKPRPGDLVAECKLMKLGKRLAVGEVTIWSDGQEEPVAHAVTTYSIPRED